MMGPLSLYRAYKKIQERDLQLRLLDTHAEHEALGSAATAIKILDMDGHMKDPLVKPFMLTAFDRFAKVDADMGLQFAGIALRHAFGGELGAALIEKTLSRMDDILENRKDRENAPLLAKAAQLCGSIMDRLSVETLFRSKTEKRWNNIVSQLATVDIRKALAECAAYANRNDVPHSKPGTDMWLALARKYGQSEEGKMPVTEEALRIILGTPGNKGVSFFLRPTAQNFLREITSTGAPVPQAPSGAAAPAAKPA